MREQLLRTVRDAVKSFAVDTYGLENQAVVSTPLSFPNGDLVPVFVSADADGFALSDSAATCDFLSERKVDLNAMSPSVVRSILSLRGCELCDREVRLRTSPARLSSGILHLAQTAIQLSTLSYHSGKTEKPDYAEVVAQVIRRTIEPARSVTRNWHEPTYDPHGVFPIDFHINGDGRPRNVFVISSTGKIMRMAAATYFLRANGLDHPTIAVIAPDVELGPKQRDRAQMAASELLFGVENREDQLKEFALACD